MDRSTLYQSCTCTFGVRACCLEPERRGIRNDCDSHSWPILPCSIYIVDRVAPGRGSIHKIYIYIILFIYYLYLYLYIYTDPCIYFYALKVPSMCECIGLSKWKHCRDACIAVHSLQCLTCALCVCVCIVYTHVHSVSNHTMAHAMLLPIPSEHVTSGMFLRL